MDVLGSKGGEEGTLLVGRGNCVPQMYSHDLVKQTDRHNATPNKQVKVETSALCGDWDPVVSFVCRMQRERRHISPLHWACWRAETC